MTIKCIVLSWSAWSNCRINTRRGWTPLTFWQWEVLWQTGHGRVTQFGWAVFTWIHHEKLHHRVNVTFSSFRTDINALEEHEYILWLFNKKYKEVYYFSNHCGFVMAHGVGFLWTLIPLMPSYIMATSCPILKLTHKHNLIQFYWNFKKSL